MFERPQITQDYTCHLFQLLFPFLHVSLALDKPPDDGSVHL